MIMPWFPVFQKYQKDVLSYQTEKTKKRRSLGPMTEFVITRDKVKTANERYQNLKTAADSLMEKLQQTKEKQKDFEDVLERMHDWLEESEGRVTQLQEEPVTGDAQQVQEELDGVKAFSAETIAQGKQYEDLKKTARALMESLQDLGADDQTLLNIDQMVGDIKDRLGDVNAAITDRSNALQTALVQSQGVQEGLDSLLGWVKDAEQNLNSMKPISLDKDVLNDQMQELQMLKSDVESHVPSMESVNQSAYDMIESSKDDSTAKDVSEKLKDLNSRFEKVAEKCKEREEDLSEVSDKLVEFLEFVKKYEDWIEPALKNLESKETAQLDTALFKEHIQEVKLDSEEKANELEAIKNLGQDLVQSDLTGDVREVKDKVAECQKKWGVLTDSLKDREQEAEDREKQAGQFDDLGEEIKRWLTEMEAKVDNLEPVAIDVEIIAKQIEELQVSQPYGPSLCLPPSL